MNKKIIFIVIFLCVIGLLINPTINFIYGEPEIILNAEKEVKNYLLNQKKYKESEIQSLKGIYNFKVGTKEERYSVEIIFTDEPDIKYYYQSIGNKVEQTGMTGTKGKHKELKSS